MNKEYINGKPIRRRPSERYFGIAFTLLNVVTLYSLTFVKLNYYVAYMSLKNESSLFSKNASNTSIEDHIQRKGIPEYKPHMLFESSFLLVTDCLIFAWYCLSCRAKLKAIKKLAELHEEKCSCYTKKRIEFLREKTKDISADIEDHISRLLSAEKKAVFINIDHFNFLLNPLPREDIYYNLKKFMFSLTWEDIPLDLPPFIDIVTYFRDVMIAVNYLHDRRIYHLAISPENILIVKCPVNPYWTVKIANFQFATQTDSGIVDKEKVKVDWIYR